MLYCPRCRQRIDPPATTCLMCGGLPGQELGEVQSNESSHRDNKLSLLKPTPLSAADEEQIAATGHQADWKCPGCGELVPASFEICWKCLMTESGEQTVVEEPVREVKTQVDIDIDLEEDSHAFALQRTKCTSCGSTRLIPHVRIDDRDERGSRNLKVVVYGDPSALIFKDRRYEDLTANICGDCGHVELRVANPRGLYQHYLSSKK